ncbi:transglycosylase [Chryseobacterium daecheongense]|uniref:Transglycosylase n=1 Tax=Chryseobacterium daecheongense TaxID=192389 RepID=A0A3N0VYV7_9FLAO|nr:hypothetical protein EGI05_11585 [Chryseobacterium daecheongense]TDX92831.1 transglycosylase [Chryseobacterium daecheongense]
MKYFKRFLILVILAFILLIIYIEFGGHYIINKDDKQSITWYIRSSSKLPENFTGFYNTVYPNALSNNSWDLVRDTFSSSKTTRKECPCSQTANLLFPVLDIKNKNTFDIFWVTRYIEHRYTQKECLNFNFSNFDFLENRKGTEQISQSLFNKQTKALKPIEMGEILALYENPVKNNRNRNPEQAKSRAKYFCDLYSENLNK